MQWKIAAKEKENIEKSLCEILTQMYRHNEKQLWHKNLNKDENEARSMARESAAKHRVYADYFSAKLVNF